MVLKVIRVVCKCLLILFWAHGRITFLHPLALYNALANEMGIQAMYGLRANTWFILSVLGLSK